ncbi:MAG: DUF1800 domain-containing protein [Solirubrobacterales bacterium]
MAVEQYRGKFGRAQAERLLWRLGFGPRRGEIARFAGLGLDRAVAALIDPIGPTVLDGRAPVLEGGTPLDPVRTRNHEQLWWLDRITRVNHPFRERMTLIWHDWFATSNTGVGGQRVMLEQNRTIRRLATGSFPDLLLAMTRDPAMLVWLSGNRNTRLSPNENYAREMMELFTLGAGARYTESDVREQSRALTGWRSLWDADGYYGAAFDPARHDTGLKTVFRKRGSLDWADACRLCIEHPDHPRFFVTKLWSYFVPTPPSNSTASSLTEVYLGNGRQVLPVVRAIVKHPDLFSGPRMVKSPILFLAGLMRLRGASVNSSRLLEVMRDAGQSLFYPPSVAGWDDAAWLNTHTFHGRWEAARSVAERESLNPHDPVTRAKINPRETARSAVSGALAYWDKPLVGPETTLALTQFAQRCQDQADADWERTYYRIMRTNALRTLIAVSPEMQTC